MTGICLFTASKTRDTMVLELLIPVMVGFVIVNIAAYIGTLRALEVYFEPSRSSYFLSDDHEPPKSR